jgi:carbon-monoxide dehydrogenase small subunit
MPEAAAATPTIEKIAVNININGKSYLRQIEPRMLLVEFLREACDLTGTHVGCDTTYCGACTVLMNGLAVKSCTMFAAQADGSEITTVEGLEKDGKLHPIQKAFGDSYGLQCGYWSDALISSVALRESRAERKRNSAGHRRQHLPLHRVYEHLQGHRTRRPEHEG